MPGARPLLISEIQQMIDRSPSTRDRCLFCILGGTGLRLGEVQPLHLKHLMNSAGEVSGRIHVPAKHVKGKRNARILPLPPPAIISITRWLLDHPTPLLDSPLFPGTRNYDLPISQRQLERVISAAAAECHLEGKVTAHSFRKYYAQKMYVDLGKDIHLTARALNHVSPSSTIYYLDQDGGKIEEAQKNVLRLDTYERSAS